MKKLHILIPSLVATASMPLVSLVGCGDPQPEPEHDVIDLEVSKFTTYFSTSGYLFSDPISAKKGDTLNVTAKFDQWEITRPPATIDIADEPYSDFSKMVTFEKKCTFHINDELLISGTDYVMGVGEKNSLIRMIWDENTNRTFDKNGVWTFDITLSQDITNKYLFIQSLLD